MNSHDNETLNRHLLEMTGPSVHLVSHSTALKAALNMVSKSNGFELFEWNGLGLTAATDLFDRIAGAMSFPDYFGRNWDALNELWEELWWIPPAPGYLLLFAQADDYFVAYPEHLKAFTEVAAYAADVWREKGSRFHVIVTFDHDLNEHGLAMLSDGQACVHCGRGAD